MTITDLLMIVAIPMLGAVLGMTFRFHIVLNRIEGKLRELELIIGSRDKGGETEKAKSTESGHSLTK